MTGALADSLLQLSKVVAVYGVFAFAVIYIFYQQRRAANNYKSAKTPESKAHFRRIHTCEIAATYMLVATATVAWAYGNFWVY